ncbi:MAG: MFS transporter [Acidimicrobiales bacterium]
MKRLPGSVWMLGAVSFFNDVASEMLYPLLPIFITRVLGAPVAVLGLIDGVAGGGSALFKVFFGHWSDRSGRRKPFVLLGYVTSCIAKVLIALSRTWGLVFVARVCDRFGKGVRSGARDALLLEASTPTNRGLIFGFQQTLDSAGAVIGPLVALVLLQVFAERIRTILFIAIIPSVIGVVLAAFVRESTSPRVGHATASRTNGVAISKLDLQSLPRELRVFLVVSALFSLGNSSDSFLLLRARSIGLSLSLVVLVYICYNLVYSLASTPAGMLADRFGPRRIYAAGITLYVVVYLGFAFNHSLAGAWVLFGVYGFYIALTDSVSRALVASFVTDQSQAAGIFGLLQTVLSVGLVAASIVGGVLWSTLGAWATFAFASLCALAALVVFATSELRHVRIH